MSTGITRTSTTPPPAEAMPAPVFLGGPILVAAPPVTRCPVCRHRARGQCEWCGGAMGHPAMGLPPCPVCPHGRRIA